MNQLQQARVQVMYQQGRSTRYIASQFGIGKTTLLDVLKRRGVAMRPRGRTNKQLRRGAGKLEATND